MKPNSKQKQKQVLITRFLDSKSQVDESSNASSFFFFFFLRHTPLKKFNAQNASMLMAFSLSRDTVGNMGVSLNYPDRACGLDKNDTRCLDLTTACHHKCC